MEYTYIGDRFTDPKYKGKPCRAFRTDGKCIRGKNGNMLVEFGCLRSVVVLARLLRKVKTKSTMNL
jgi:hypothetical protein